MTTRNQLEKLYEFIIGQNIYNLFNQINLMKNLLDRQKKLVKMYKLHSNINFIIFYFH